MSISVMAPTSHGTFTVLFPIDDDEMILRDLKAEAKDRTIAALTEAGLIRTSPVQIEANQETRLISTKVQVKWTGAQPVIRGYVD